MQLLAQTREEHSNFMKENKSTTINAGIGFGCSLAIAISFTTHKSILWAILHGFFSWFYVIYYAITQ